MKIENLSDSDLKSVCGGLDMPIVQEPQSPSPSLPDAALEGIATALSHIRGWVRW